MKNGFMKAVLLALSLSLMVPSVGSAQDGRFRFNVNADIYDVVQLLHDKTRVNIVLHKDVPHESVTLDLDHVTLQDVLNALYSTYDLESAWVGPTLVIGPAAEMNRQFASGCARLVHGGGSVSNSLTCQGTVRTDVFKLKYAQASDVQLVLTQNKVLPDTTVIAADPRQNEIYVTGGASTIARAREMIENLDAGPSDLATVMVPLKYARGKDVLATLTSAYQSGQHTTAGGPNGAMSTALQPSISLSPNGDAIMVTGPSAYVNEVKQGIALMDLPGQQVIFEIAVADYAPDTLNQNIGVQFGGVDGAGAVNAGGYATTWTFLNNTIGVNATINVLDSHGHATILANPILSAMNNQKATLDITQEVPVVFVNGFTGSKVVERFTSGIQLSMTPSIGVDGSVLADVDASYSEFTQFTNDGIPVTSTRHATSTIRIPNGYSLTLGGLYRDVDSTTISKIPWLGDLPLIGGFFRNKQRTHNHDEIAFIITPHIITDRDYKPAHITTPSAIIK